MGRETLRIKGFGVGLPLACGVWRGDFGVNECFLIAVGDVSDYHKGSNKHATMKTSSDKYRGLWVGKLGKSGRPQRDIASVPPGKRPWDLWPEDFYPVYYYRIQGKLVGGKVVQRSLETTDYREALKRARCEWDILDKARWDGRAQALADLAKPKKVATAGEIFKAYLAVMKKHSNIRAVQSARLFYAIGKGWVKCGGRGKKGSIREGSELAQRIDAVPGDVLFSPQSVREYFTARQGGVFDPVGRKREHFSYNRAVKFARELFARMPMAHCYSGLVLPELEGFRTFPLLAQESIDTREAAIDPAAFARMVVAARSMEDSEEARDRDLALINWLLRTLGLRTRELLFARTNWLWQDPRGGRWYLDVRNRPEEGYTIKGKEGGQIPLADDLRVRLQSLPAGFLFFPEGSPTARRNLIEDTHNAWLKGFIGETHSRQGNHRLRKHVASFVAARHGIETSGNYLRHGDKGETAKAHYVATRRDDLPVVSDADLLGWE